MMGTKNALVIQVNQPERVASRFENINQYYVMCKNELDKYLILFMLKKLGMVQGKLLITTTDIIQAYRAKFFFNRFHMKAFVLSPELAKQQIQSIVHFYTIGQFDILIILSDGYGDKQLPELKEVSFVVNLEVPHSYTSYKQITQNVQRPDGSVINLISNKKDQDLLGQYQKKIEKAYGRSDVLKCIPIIWHEVVKMKTRVEGVLSTLGNKRVKDEKLIEFKK